MNIDVVHSVRGRRSVISRWLSRGGGGGKSQLDRYVKDNRTWSNNRLKHVQNVNGTLSNTQSWNFSATRELISSNENIDSHVYEDPTHLCKDIRKYVSTLNVIDHRVSWDEIPHIEIDSLFRMRRHGFLLNDVSGMIYVRDLWSILWYKHPSHVNIFYDQSHNLVT